MQLFAALRGFESCYYPFVFLALCVESRDIIYMSDGAHDGGDLGDLKQARSVQNSIQRAMKI